MKPCNFYLPLLFVLFTFQSCSNELDVLADYEENASVYGLLDASQPVQFIKINKVFTNPGVSAADVAKIADSLYFDTILNLKLVETGTGREIKLERANTLLKDSGYFARSPNYLYATKQRLSSKQTYRLEMDLPQSKKHIVATTDIPDSIRLASPTSVYFGTVDIPEEKFVIQFNTTLNSKIFDMYFYFNYLEIDKADTNNRVAKTVRWKVLNKERALSESSIEQIKRNIASASFYDLLLSSAPANPAVYRRFLPCKLEIIAGNLELDNYIQATEPSIGIVQKQTEYTNVSGGIGIFASRRTSSYNFLNPSTKMKDLIIGKGIGFVN